MNPQGGGSRRSLDDGLGNLDEEESSDSDGVSTATSPMHVPVARKSQDATIGKSWPDYTLKYNGVMSARFLPWELARVLDGRKVKI